MDARRLEMLCMQIFSQKTNKKLSRIETVDTIQSWIKDGSR